MKTLATFTILAIGTLQILGHLAGSRTLRGLGLVSGIAPYPKVFCEADGYEPFAAKFTLVGEDSNGITQHIPIDAERYSLLEGPYNRRNAYGAALAYAPRLPEDLRKHLFTQLSPLFSELNLPELHNARLIITPRNGEAVQSYEYPLTY